MLTSDYLEEGCVCTPEDLCRRFEVPDAVGVTSPLQIYQPPGHDSVWIFVTARPPSGTGRAANRLDTATLYFEGSQSGSKDQLIIKHKQNRCELLVFYRKRRDEFPHGGFRYEGRFQYEIHYGSHPARFVLQRIPQGKRIPPREHVPTVSKPNALPAPQLGVLLQALDVDERWWYILEARINENHSLGEVADTLGGLSRERVRQLQSKSTKRIEQKLLALEPAFDALEAHARLLWSPDEEPPLAVAVGVCQTMFVEAGWERPRDAEVRRFLLTLRLLAFIRHTGPEMLWPKLSFAACTVAPQITAHPGVVRKERERTHRWTNEELAEAVLKEANKPLHWREIAERAEALGRRDNLSIRAISNTLSTQPDTFARVGPGTYGLTAWGLTTVDPYTDIIAQILKAAQTPLTYGAIFQRVNAIRRIKESTLQMYLDIHPRFYRSMEDAYGLRIWLPPREKQTLRTPDWQVEEKDSFERVTWAEDRGYDVSRIVAEDLAS